MSIGRQKYALFVSVPLVGHMNPLLRQAEELARRGYDVALASTSEARSYVEGSRSGTPVAASGFSPAHVKLSNAGDGSHNVAGDQGIGISVYGVIDYGSYWYPGGLDLDVIPQ
jgi:hypothetical protein